MYSISYNFMWFLSFGNKVKVLGIELDEEANNFRGEERLITTKTSKIPVWVVPTNEELMIAKDTYNLVK